MKKVKIDKTNKGDHGWATRKRLGNCGQDRTSMRTPSQTKKEDQCKDKGKNSPERNPLSKKRKAVNGQSEESSERKE